MTDFSLPVRVYYEDTDAGGVVYHSNYLKYMERTRTEWLRELGFEQEALLIDPGIVFVVRRVEMDFLQAARFDDMLTVTASVVARRKASLTFAQQVVRAGDAKTLTSARILVACVSAGNFRPTAVPLEILEKMTDAD